eukprot:gene11829-13055_t
MEGSICLIHKKIVDGDIYRKKGNPQDFTSKMVNETFAQSDNTSVSKDELSSRLAQVQLNDGRHQSLSGGKRSVILWTKEQLDILKEVGSRLMDSKSKKMQILISGPKGSGKTLLLSYLAYLAKNIFISQESWRDGDVIIADGRCGSSLLAFDQLKEDFDGTGISVYGGSGTFPDSMKKLAGELVLIDECNALLEFMELISNLKDVQGHIIMFTSRGDAPDYFSFYQHLKLTNTLRATAGLVRFCEEFRSLDSSPLSVPGTPAHNLEGGAPDIRCYEIDVAKDPLQLEYIESCFAAINEVMHKSRGLERVLLTPYVHPITLERIIHRIQEEGYDCEFRNPLDLFSFRSNSVLSSTSKSNLHDTAANGTSASLQDTTEFPKIIFVTGNHVDGAEYGAVIVLLERSLPPWWNNYIFDSLYIAITRATVSLHVLVNHTHESPLIVCKHTYGKAKPSSWSNVDESSDVDIRSFTEIRSGADDFFENLEDIMYTNRKNTRPTLVVGRLQSLTKWTEVDPPSELSDIKGEQPRLENVKWFESQKGSKITLIDSFQISKNLSDFYLAHPLLRFSSIVILISTQAEMDELSLSNRHDLQFVLYQHQLSTCPIYLLTSCETTSFVMLNTSKICNFFSSNYRRTLKVPEDKREDMVATAQTWESAKKRGTDCLNEGKLDDALSHYKCSWTILKRIYQSSLTTARLNQVVNYREEMAKLCTNLSKVYLDLALSKHEKIINAEMSLQFAEKSVEMCPTWDKGYYRIIQASKILGENNVAAIAKEKRKKLKISCRAQEINQSHRHDLLTEIMHASACWQLLKYQDNAFLVDQNGEGHFISVMEAVQCNKGKPVSLLVNPGIYKGCIVLINEQVDIVGNCAVKTHEKKEWILEDPCVVLQDGESVFHRVPGGQSYSSHTILVDNSHLYLTRVSVQNWKPVHKLKLDVSDVLMSDVLDVSHAVYGKNSDFWKKSKSPDIDTRIEATNCAFLSKCAAAISVESPGTDILLSGSRFIDCYGAVLAINGCRMSLTKCSFEKTKVAGVELKDRVTAVIEDCSFKNCEEQGLMATAECDLEVKRCVFINNGTRKGPSEGSIQLKNTTAFISKSKVLSQIGCGIVIEWGKCKFEGVTIDRCLSNGILTQAPIDVKQCTIRNCLCAVLICPNVEGEIRLEDNRITDCGMFYATSSVRPTLINNNVKTMLETDNALSVDPLLLGKSYHELILTNREILRAGQVYSPIDDIKGSINEKGFIDTKHPYPICRFCNKRKTDQDTTYFLCSCEVVFYCSKKCAEKDKDMHKPHCDHHKKAVELYRRSINYKDDIEGKAANTKVDQADDQKCSAMAMEEIQPPKAKSAGTSQFTKKKKKKKK